MLLQSKHSGSGRFDDYSDVELFRMIRETPARAESAFRELYSRLAGNVYAYCRCLAWRRDESDDLFQETFARLYESALHGRDVTNVPGYTVKIARNLYLNMQRDKKPTVLIEDDTLSMRDVPHERTEMLELIHMAMELLSDDYREAFFLREFADLPYSEIASIMNLTNANVRIRVTRAREKIRGILQPYIAEYEQEQ